MTGNTPSEAEKHCKSTKTLTVSYKEGEILFFFFLLSSFRRAISIFLNRSQKKKKKKQCSSAQSNTISSQLWSLTKCF